MSNENKKNDIIINPDGYIICPCCGKETCMRRTKLTNTILHTNLYEQEFNRFFQPELINSFIEISLFCEKCKYDSSFIKVSGDYNNFLIKSDIIKRYTIKRSKFEHPFDLFKTIETEIYEFP